MNSKNFLKCQFTKLQIENIEKSLLIKIKKYFKHASREKRPSKKINNGEIFFARLSEIIDMTLASGKSM